MKKCVGLVVMLLFACCCWAEQVIAFPDAEGFGKYATGGRGGKVYYVTSLADCTDADLVPGTLRWALRDGDDTPRTILFKVCGTIYLTSKLKFAHPNVTIAGQTAPGGGICITGANIYVCKPNVIIRHIRFRAGDIPTSSYPALDIENTQRVIIDHCSLTWSMEECLTMYDTDSTTVQYCIIGEGLYNSKNNKGARAYATQWGGEHSTMHHCLITNCLNRCPRFNGVRDEADLKNGKHNHDAQVVSEFANNVVFNWGKQNALYGGECDTTKNRDASGTKCLGYNEVYMLNNWFQVGPATQAYMSSTTKYRFVVPNTSKGYGSWLLRGNRFSVDLPLNDNNIPSDWPAGAPVLTLMRDSSQLNLQSAADAYTTVCASAGAWLPRLDEEDNRLLQEAAGLIKPQFTGPTAPSYIGIIDSQNDITFARQDYFLADGAVMGGYPFLDAVEGDQLVLDTDGDGLPDAYEIKQGLNPNDNTDAAQLTSGGYSYLEVYLNGVADGTIDKTQYETETYVSQEPTPSGIRIVLNTPSIATKHLRNGQLWLMRGGKRYSVLGQQR
ncbi:MAG: Por secretion system protein [Paludibacteraceae bacterium]|nr:Por secretion system protein [Paludibacteraceae bacterium]